MVSYAELCRNANGRHLLLLLTEAAPPKAKAGIPALASRVLDLLTQKDGPLDELLAEWAAKQGFVTYQHLALPRDNKRLLIEASVCWLPQVRLVRNGKILLRSSVAMGDNNQFIAQNVGGLSLRFAPGQQAPVTLLAALDAELERTSLRREIEAKKA
jgi:hypothetical protein